MSRNWGFLQSRVMGLLKQRQKQREEVATCIDDFTDRAEFQPDISIEALKEADKLQRAREDKESTVSAFAVPKQGMKGTHNIKPLRQMQQHRGSVLSSSQSLTSARSFTRRGSTMGSTPMRNAQRSSVFRHPNTKLMKRRKPSIQTDSDRETTAPDGHRGDGPTGNTTAEALLRLEQHVDRSNARLLEAIAQLSRGEVVNLQRTKFSYADADHDRSGERRQRFRERSGSNVSGASVQSIAVPVAPVHDPNGPLPVHSSPRPKPTKTLSMKIPPKSGVAGGGGGAGLNNSGDQPPAGPLQPPAASREKRESSLSSSKEDGNEFTADLMGLLEDGSQNGGAGSESKGGGSDSSPASPTTSKKIISPRTRVEYDGQFLSPHSGAKEKKNGRTWQPQYGSEIQLSYQGESRSGYDSDPDSLPPSYLLEDLDEEPSFLPDSPFRRVWDCLYMLVVAYDVCLWLMAVFTIEDGSVVIDHTDAMTGIRAGITLFWWADIYIQSHTSRLVGFNFIDTKDDLRRMYFYSIAFGIDLLASLPMDTICFAAGATTIGYHLMVFRCLRLLRAPDQFRQSSPTAASPGWIMIVMSTFWLIIFIQFSVCIWLRCATLEEQRLTIPVSEDPWLAYSQALYFVVTMLTSVGFGDISPRSIWMMYYVSFINVVGALLLIVGGGRAGAVFITTDPYELDVCERKRRLEYLMERNEVPWATQREAFKVYPVIVEASIRDYGSILSDLPEYVQDQITYHVKRKVLKKVPMFASLSQYGACLLAWKLEEFFVRPKEYIIRAGDDGVEMFFLASGVVEVIAREANGDEHWTANLTDGSWFGEIALLKKTKRIASVRSLTRCALYRLHKYDFDKVCGVCGELKQVLEQETARRVNYIKHQLSAMSLNELAEEHAQAAGPDKPETMLFAPQPSGTLRVSEIPTIARNLEDSVETDASFSLQATTSMGGRPPHPPNPPQAHQSNASLKANEDMVIAFAESAHLKPIPSMDLHSEGSSGPSESR